MAINMEPGPTGIEVRKKESVIEVEGTDVHYVQAGQGQDLVMVSGLLASSRAFDFVLDPFAKNFRTIAVDLPGFGVSGRHLMERRYSPGEHAKTVVGLMDKLGIKQTGLIGDSYGCAVAMVAATDYPDRISYLVLQGPPKFDFLKKITKFPEHVSIRLAKDIRGAKGLAFWFRRLNPEFMNMTQEQLINADNRLSAVSARAGIQAGFDVVNFDFAVCATKLTVPTLIIEGNNPVALAVSSARIIKESAVEGLVTINRFNGSHTLLQQRPNDFVEAVVDFKKKVEGAVG